MVIRQLVHVAICYDHDRNLLVRMAVVRTCIQFIYDEGLMQDLNVYTCIANRNISCFKVSYHYCTTGTYEKAKPIGLLIQRVRVIVSWALLCFSR